MPKIFFVAGEAGAGKTTLIRGALKEYPDDLRYLQTYTTRPPREAHEPEYVFVGRSQYDALREASSQWDHGEYYGNYYGCDVASANETLRSGTSLIVSTMADVAALDAMKALYADADPYTMYIKAERQLRAARLAGRGILAETSRLEVDDILAAEFGEAADLVFEAPGGIEESKIAFNKIVGELIHG